jgi:hypothetical protein
MVNYANGKVYKIESPLGDKIYIGSTTKTQLSMRMSKHRADYKNWKNGKYNMVTSYLIFEKYGVENCKIVLLENYPCESKDQLSAREAHFIRTLECVNKVVPLRTKAEYYVDNREAITEKHKAYRETNRVEIAEKAKAYRETNQAKIAEKNKTYYESNQAECLAKSNAYYDANRDAIKERARARYHAKKDQIKI